MGHSRGASARPVILALTVAASFAGSPPAARAGAAPSSFDGMLQRPLFSPSRRPPPPSVDSSTQPGPQVALAPPPIAQPALTLSGVISGDGVGVALVQRPGDGAPLRVALGTQVDGWTVAEIHPRSIVLRLGARTATFGLSAR